MEFACSAEARFAALLDVLGIAWRYEPVLFELERSDRGLTRGFRPDFYLVDLDLYVELSTQRSDTRKRKKLRELSELHPDVRCVLLGRRELDLLGG